MNKKLSRPILIGLNIIWFLVAISSATYITLITKLPTWSLVFPILIIYWYVSEKISRLGVQPNQPNFFQKVTIMPARDQVIFWTSALGISVISVLEGYFLKLRGDYTDVLVIMLNFMLWIGIQWISSLNLRKVIINRE